MHVRRVIALLMISAYLILPLDSLAGHSAPGGSALPVPASLTLSAHHDALQATPASEFCDLSGDSHCPCSDRHDAEGCDSSCSCCSCCSYHAPLPAPLAWSAAPPERSCRLRDPFQFLPEVYLPIFVPPQNRA